MVSPGKIRPHDLKAGEMNDEQQEQQTSLTAEALNERKRIKKGHIVVPLRLPLKRTCLGNMVD